LIGTWHGKTDACDLQPGELIFGEEFFNTFDPAGDNRAFAEFRIRGALREVEADRRAIFPNTRGFRSRCSAICAKKDFFPGWSLCVFLVLASKKKTQKTPHDPLQASN